MNVITILDILIERCYAWGRNRKGFHINILTGGITYAN